MNNKSFIMTLTNKADFVGHEVFWWILSTSKHSKKCWKSKFNWGKRLKRFWDSWILNYVGIFPWLLLKHC